MLLENRDTIQGFGSQVIFEEDILLDVFKNSVRVLVTFICDGINKHASSM